MSNNKGDLDKERRNDPIKQGGASQPIDMWISLTKVGKQAEINGEPGGMTSQFMGALQIPSSRFHGFLHDHVGLPEG